MSRAFDEREREIIRQRLMSAGEDLFGRYGLRKTSVEEIARRAGISKGSFYSFFESKELLFFTIIERIQGQQRETMNEIAKAGEGSPADRMERVINRGLAMLDSFPVLRVMMQKEEFSHLIRRVPRDRIEAEYRVDREALQRIVAESDIEMTADPEIVTGLMRAVFFVALNVQDIAPGKEKPLLDALVRLVSGALFVQKRSS